MSINLDAIKSKLSQLTGNSQPRSQTFWKPDIGDHVVRLLPFVDNDGQPFKERWFYYDIVDGPGILAPVKMGKPDPVSEFAQKLYKDGSSSSKELAKKLRPKMRAYAPVVVRGQEEKGVRLWAFGTMVYTGLLRLFVDEDYGDITDPKAGFDVKVSVSQVPGRKWPQTDVTARPRPSALSENASESTKWLDSIPELNDIYVLKSYDEIKSVLDNWAAGSEQALNGLGTESTTIRAAAASASPATPTPVHQQNIDEVFDQLLKD
tara:strand:+ start:3585 stop:4373 length:789 start_codon:yes stop_codon:yes gene_type:complete